MSCLCLSFCDGFILSLDSQFSLLATVNKRLLLGGARRIDWSEAEGNV
jgi:hypothetical protein